MTLLLWLLGLALRLVGIVLAVCGVLVLDAAATLYAKADRRKGKVSP